jgi:hypothetical protein
MTLNWLLPHIEVLASSLLLTKWGQIFLSTIKGIKTI